MVPHADWHRDSTHLRVVDVWAMRFTGVEEVFKVLQQLAAAGPVADRFLTRS